MSLAYSVTLALAGGTAPLVAAWRIDTFGQPLAPAYYIMAYRAIGLALMAPMVETNRRRPGNLADRIRRRSSWADSHQAHTHADLMRFMECS
jgi:hypothetical protein